MKDILKNLDFVTSNVKLRKYIENCIKDNGGGLKYFNKCDYFLKNDSNDIVYINIFNDCIYVYVTNIFGREEVSYKKASDGVNIQFNSFRKFLDVGGLQVVRVTEENTCYDNCGMLISHCCEVNENTYINGEVCTELMYANYCRKISDYLIDDELVRIEEFNYNYHPELNRSLCYVSDYQYGMFCSGDDSMIINPRFIPFNKDFSEYGTKIKKNNIKSLKI